MRIWIFALLSALIPAIVSRAQNATDSGKVLCIITGAKGVSREETELLRDFIIQGLTRSENRFPKAQSESDTFGCAPDSVVFDRLKYSQGSSILTACITRSGGGFTCTMRLFSCRKRTAEAAVQRTQSGIIGLAGKINEMLKELTNAAPQANFKATPHRSAIQEKKASVDAPALQNAPDGAGLTAPLQPDPGKERRPVCGDGEGVYQKILLVDEIAIKIMQNYVTPLISGDMYKFLIQIDKMYMKDSSLPVAAVLDMLPTDDYTEIIQSSERSVNTAWGGIGIQISIRDGVLTVVSPMAGTPAYRAGIQAGDQILSIDGKLTKGCDIENAVCLLRGEPGSTITLALRRYNASNYIHLALTREIIALHSVSFSGIIDGTIGYVRLNDFSAQTGKEVENALKGLVTKKIKGIILDLRGNPGGLLAQSVEVAENLLPDKTLIFSTKGSAKNQNQNYYSSGVPVMPPQLPLAVLVDYGSAGASEIVAGAVQDWDRGVVVGDTTFGSGSVQTIFPISKSCHLKLTTAFYYTPSGRRITADTQTNKSDANQPRFKTRNGRSFADQCGIVPDTTIARNIPELVKSMQKDHVFEKFAVIYRDKIGSGKKIKAYSNINEDALISDFTAFAATVDSGYSTSRILNENRLKSYIISALIGVVFGYESPEYIQYLLSTDAQYKAAAKILNDAAIYKRILWQR
jgi:C-terminal peptidase prc